MAVSDLNNPAHPGHSNHLIPTDGRKARRIWVPDTPLLESVQNELLNICQSHMRERCGLISSEWEVYEISNTHDQPFHNYYMAPEHADPVLKEIYEVRQEKVIAQWHTHPNNVTWPTPRDLMGWPNLALKWRYFIVTNGEVIEWELVK